MLLPQKRTCLVWCDEKMIVSQCPTKISTIIAKKVMIAMVIVMNMAMTVWMVMLTMTTSVRVI